MSGPTNPVELYFDKGQWGYDGAIWRPLNLVWGYNNRLFDQLAVADSAAGTVNVSHTTVPAGYVWVIVGASVVDSATAAAVYLKVSFAGTNGYVYDFGTLTINTYKCSSPLNIILKAGDIPIMQFGGCTLHDVLISTLWGYKMKVA